MANASTGTCEDERPPQSADRDLWRALRLLLIEDSIDLHTLVDCEGRFEFVNRASEAILGVPPEECIGRLAFDWVHPDDQDLTRRAFASWLSTTSRLPISFENRQVHASGAVRELSWTIYARHGEGGEIIGFASTARDVTDRRRIERALVESEALHRALLDGLLEPAVTIDEKGIIQHCSESVETVFGYRPDELVGRNISMLMPEPHRGQHDGYLEQYNTTGATHILGRTREFQAVRKDRSLIDIELSVARVDITSRSAPVFVGSLRDVTERKRAQRAESSMLRALAALGESSAVLAHEIKTPVTAVHMALRAVTESLGEDSREAMEDLVRRLKRLEQQMRQTLSFAKPIALDIHPCDARDLFRDVIRTQRPILDGAGILVEVDVDADMPKFGGDFGRLAEALTNLVSNAVEVLPHAGRLRLSARRSDEGHVRLSVEDDGPGIPADTGQDIFKPYITTKAQGTGLGLPIARRIVEEHGGTMSLDHGDLAGACFSIVLPNPSPQEQAGEP